MLSHLYNFIPYGKILMMRHILGVGKLMEHKSKLLMLAAVIVAAVVVLAAYVVLINDGNDNDTDVGQKKYVGDPENLALVQADLSGTEWILSNYTELSWENQNIPGACRGTFIINPDGNPETAGFGWTIYVFNTTEQANDYYDNGEDFTYWHYSSFGNWTNINGIGVESMYNKLELFTTAWPYINLTIFRSSNVVVVLGFSQKVADTGFTMDDTFVDSLIQAQVEKIEGHLV
jgi:hypothetical protein